MRDIVKNFDYVQQQHDRYFFVDSNRVDDLNYVMQSVLRDDVFSIFEMFFEQQIMLLRCVTQTSRHD
jgi:hypothetical protein